MMDIPISFNADLLSQLISPAWLLIFELNPSRKAYNLRRLTRRLSVLTGRVGRTVLMFLYTLTPKEKKNTTIGWGEKRQ